MEMMWEKCVFYCFGAQLDKLIVGCVYNSLQCSGLVDAAGSQLQKKEKDMNTHTQ